MNSSDTPRTDGWVAENGDDGLVNADFARELERELTAANERIAALLNWLNNNTSFYTVDHAELSADDVNVPILASISKSIWYHATNDQESFPFSAVIERALESRHALNPQQKEPTNGTSS